MVAVSPSDDELQWVRPPQQTRSKQTLARLLDAAEELVIERGFEGTTVADITRRADSSVGAFYSRFSDKDGLLHCLLERFSEDAEATVDAVFAPERWCHAPLDHVVRTILDFTVRTYCERRRLVAALAQFTARVPGTSFRDALGAHLCERIGALLGARGERIGRPCPEAALATFTWIVLGALEAAAVQGQGAPPELSRDQLVDELTDMCLSYLAIERCPERSL